MRKYGYNPAGQVCSKDKSQNFTSAIPCRTFENDNAPPIQNGTSNDNDCIVSHAEDTED